MAVDLINGAADHVTCLGTTKAGHPRHPLYIGADQPLVRYEGTL